MNSSIKLYDALNESTTQRRKSPDLAKSIKNLLSMGAIVVAFPFVVAGNSIMSAIRHSKNSKIPATTMGSSDFTNITGQMQSLANKLLDRQKKSKYYSLVYRYHTNGFADTAGNAINITSAFNQGKVVYPVLFVTYYTIDSIGKYKELLKTMPNQDESCDSVENAKVLHAVSSAISDEMMADLAAIGYNPESHKCTGFPDVDIDYTRSDNGSWITLEMSGIHTVHGIIKAK